MKKPFLSLLWALIILSGIGCKRIPYLESTPNSILPLELGNWWEYVETIEISDSSSILATHQDTIRMKVTEKGYLDWNNPDADVPYVHLETYEVFITRPGNTIVLYLRPESSSIFLIAKRKLQEESRWEGPCALGPPSNIIYHPIIPFPDTVLNAKGLWPHMSWGCVEDSILGRFQSAGYNNQPIIHFQGEEFVSVSSGSFQAINFSNKEWWSPGVGLVKMEQTFDGASIPYRRYHVSRELLAYGE